MPEFEVSFHGATDVGRKRDNNEDTFIARYIWDDNHILLVAIDGMGGEEGGEVAAEIAEKAIARYLDENREDSNSNLIRNAVARANDEIIAEKETNSRLRKMGCVATAGLMDLEEGTLSIAHVGDSRLYRLSGGVLEKLTHDHSMVGYQEEQGLISEEEAMHHPMRSVIDRCLGYDEHSPEDKHFIDTSIFPLVDGEAFLFCSDGLCDMLRSAEISEILGEDASTEQKCDDLIKAANEAGGKDNVTVVVAEVKSKEKPTVIYDPNNSSEEPSVITDNMGQTEDSLPLNQKKKWSTSAWVLFILDIVLVVAICIIAYLLWGRPGQ